jgi:DNA polymerase-4
MTHKKLKAMGIKTLGDVRKFSEASLVNRMGKFGHRLLELAFGADASPVATSPEHKSISSEETLASNTSDKLFLSQYMLRQSEDVGRQLRKLALKAKTVTIKIKHGDFKQITRSHTISSPTRSSETIYKEAKKLLDAYPMKKQVRLIGVGVSGLVAESAPTQLSLFDNREKEDQRWEKVDKALDSISQKFGTSAVKRATLRQPE